MAFDATVGGAAATSYVSVADALAYCRGRLFADAFAGVLVGHDDRERALQMATAWLDGLPWRGQRATAAQRLAWPRIGAPVVDPGPDGPVTYPETTIPRPVLEATCELALALLGADEDPAGAVTNVAHEQIRGLATTYAPASHQVRGLARYSAVMARVAPLLRAGGTVTRT